jgi:putative ABC transport system substrate-binding protein
MRFTRQAFLLLVSAFISQGLIACSAPPDRAQYAPAVPRRIAVLVVSDLYEQLSARGLIEGMEALGYHESEDIVYSIYNAQGDAARLPDLARRIAADNPDVICPVIVPAIQAVKDTGTSQPVVFLESMYPVELGFVRSLDRPGNNFTGVSNMTGPMSGKRLEMLKAMVPAISRVAVICNSDNQVAMMALEETKRAAAVLNLELEIHLVAKPEEVEESVSRIESGKADGLVLNPDFMVFSRLPLIIEMALRKKIPTMGIDQEQVKAGILASFGGGLKAIAAQAASQVDWVLNGRAPGDLPVEAPNRYDLFVNLSTAEKINITPAPEFLFQAAGYYR